MSRVRELWVWLGKPRTRNVLGFLGAGLAALVAALWQAYLHFAPAAAPPPPTPTLASSPQPAVDTGSLKRLQAGQERALDAETAALNNIADQIDAAGKPAGQANSARH